MKKLTLGIIISILLALSVFYLNDNKIGILFEGEMPQMGELTDGSQSQRLYKSGKAAEDGFYKAFEMMKSSGRSQLDAEAPDTWENIGPVNQGGRTLALEIDPNDHNIIYAGAASGGLWKLTSTGDGKYDYSWERIETGQPVLGVGAIAIDPRNSDVIYIGTGEAHMHRDYTIVLGRYMYTYGIGILKSSDGGETWSKSLDWSYNQSRGVEALELNPENPDILLAGTTEGLYRSVDAGASWERVLDVLMVMDIDIDPSDPDRIFAGCGNIGTPGTGIYRSTDGGDTWELLSDGLPEIWTGKTRLDIYQSDPDVIFASIYNQNEIVGMYRSDNSGDSWTFVSDFSMGTVAGLYAHYIRVNPEDKNKIFRANQYYGYSEDGGITYTYEDDSQKWWQDSTSMHYDHHAFVNHPDNPDMFYAGNDGGVYRTYDGGMTFQSLNYEYVTTQFYAGFASSATDPDLAIGGTQDNGTLVFEGNAKWLDDVLGSDGSMCAIDPENSDIIYGTYPYNTIYKSENRGKDMRLIGPVWFWDSWGWDPEIPYILRPHEDEWVKFPHQFCILPSKIMYASTNYVYKSYDGGEKWECVNNNKRVWIEPIISMAASSKNTDYVYVATYPNSITGRRAQVLLTKDGGDSWEKITEDLPDRWINVFISPHSENVIYAAMLGFGTSHLFRSLDAGDTWNDIGEGLPDVPTVTVEVDPLYYNHIYVGNDLGVWVSVDDGKTWEQFNMGLPSAVLVTDLSISDSNRKIRASTHGNGVYERTLLPKTEIEIILTPVEFELRNNYPNPFNASTIIEFKLEERAKASIVIYNTLGQIVRTFDEKEYVRGINRVHWNGRTDRGSHISSGVYLCRLTVNGISQTRRMTLVK
ncbi:T9SS type A sorting domain-containing protein [candidate division KSB1 bacterium]